MYETGYNSWYLTINLIIGYAGKFSEDVEKKMSCSINDANSMKEKGTVTFCNELKMFNKDTVFSESKHGLN